MCQTTENISTKEVSLLINEPTSVKPEIALEFYKHRETKEIFEGLDIITEK